MDCSRFARTPLAGVATTPQRCYSSASPDVIAWVRVHYQRSPPVIDRKERYMDQKTSLRFQLISAWCGPAFLVTFVLFWGVIGHNIPNPSPALSAANLAARYSQHLGQIPLGFLVGLITG